MNTYKKIVTILVIVLTGFSILMGYYIITSDTKIDFQINWNLFKSILMWPLFIIGLIVSLGMKFTSYEPWTRTEDSDGKVEYERNHDIIENMFARIVLPLLRYFVLGPLIVAAMIYYPLMTIIYLFGKIFPYLILIFFILTLVLFYQCENRLIAKNSRLFSMPSVAILFTGILWLLFILWVPSGDHSVGLINILFSFIISIIIISFISLSIWERKRGKSSESQTLSNSYKPEKISKQFIITYIISFLFVLGIYGFKVTASYGSDSKKAEDETINDIAVIYDKTSTPVSEIAGVWIA